MAHATVKAIAQYIAAYMVGYRKEYSAFVAPPPNGGGYPSLVVSPFLNSTRLSYFVARDGYAIADLSSPPGYSWDIAGGPALMTDFQEPRTPQWVVSHLGTLGLAGKPIGIYRIVGDDIPDEVWRGDLGAPSSLTATQVEGVDIEVQQYDLCWLSLIQRLTFGSCGLILKFPLPTAASPFWQPLIIRDLGFFPADRSNKRFFNLLEFGPHLDTAAWDSRGVPTRVAVDVRRDFARAFAAASEGGGGGTISFGNPRAWIERFHDRLRSLETCIAKFTELLGAASQAQEAVFHNFLRDNPLLLDVYGDVENKPRFSYPDGESPLGKSFVEPDFVVRYPGRIYKLVELERPSKSLGTAQGQSRAEVTQAAFQIAEWKTFIQKHYEVLRDRFPGISSSYSTLIVISRSTQTSIGPGRNFYDYVTLIRNQLAVDEILTYDGLLERAKGAYARIAALTPES